MALEGAEEGGKGRNVQNSFLVHSERERKQVDQRKRKAVTKVCTIVRTILLLLNFPAMPRLPGSCIAKLPNHGAQARSNLEQWHHSYLSCRCPFSILHTICYLVAARAQVFQSLSTFLKLLEKLKKCRCSAWRGSANRQYITPQWLWQLDKKNPLLFFLSVSSKKLKKMMWNDVALRQVVVFADLHILFHDAWWGALPSWLPLSSEERVPFAHQHSFIVSSSWACMESVFPQATLAPPP